MGNKPFLKIFRGLYNKIIEKSREEAYEKELKSITTTFYDEIKAYFDLKSKSE